MTHEETVAAERKAKEDDERRDKEAADKIMKGEDYDRIETMKADKDAEELEELKKTPLPTHIRINFWKDRSFFNKILYVLYKLLRIFFVFLWYYFFPFVAMMSSYIVPVIKSGKIQDAPDADVSGGDAANGESGGDPTLLLQA